MARHDGGGYFGRHHFIFYMTAGRAAAIRVGMEDNLYIRLGVLARSNAEQVEAAVQLILGRQTASPRRQEKFWVTRAWSM